MGIKVNHKYICNLLNNLDFLAISEHWLHDFDLHHLNTYVT